MLFGSTAQFVAAVSLLICCLTGCAATNMEMAPPNPLHRDYVQLSFSPNPEYPHDNPYDILVTSDGYIFRDGLAVQKGKKKLYLKILTTMQANSFNTLHSDFSLHSAACTSLSLHGSSYVVTSKVGDELNKVRLDTGCEGFDGEDRLAAVIVVMENQFSKLKLVG